MCILREGRTKQVRKPVQAAECCATRLCVRFGVVADTSCARFCAHCACAPVIYIALINFQNMVQHKVVARATTADVMRNNTTKL